MTNGAWAILSCLLLLTSEAFPQDSPSLILPLPDRSPVVDSFTLQCETIAEAVLEDAASAELPLKIPSRLKGKLQRGQDKFVINVKGDTLLFLTKAAFDAGQAVGTVPSAREHYGHSDRDPCSRATETHAERPGRQQERSPRRVDQDTRCVSVFLRSRCGYDVLALQVISRIMGALLTPASSRRTQSVAAMPGVFPAQPHQGGVMLLVQYPKGMRRFCAALLTFVFVCLTTVSGAPQNKVRWYVVTEELNAQGNSLNVGDAPQTIHLKSGWSCTIGATSKGPVHEARQTTCKKGSGSFEFTVQSEENQPKDHVQIRFRDSKGKLIDFIEVGCELASSR